MKAVAILSHVMSQEGILGEETVSRVDKSLEVFYEFKCNFLITSGWDYRNDTDLKIGSVVREYIVNKININPSCVLEDTSSRDTVGDAFFIRKKIRDLSVKRLFVITSDYHVDRARLIFESFFDAIADIKVLGVETRVSNTAAVKNHEECSVQAFRKTFEGVDFSSDHEVTNAMSTKHPFYNGVIYRKLEIADVN
ncbi:YdcF family protein [Thalassospira sp. SN3W]|uniref:YdcF family protein n=1 Tax=Thalassospira sp. SN3W TaxID=3035476 RepID=UPI00311B2621